MKKAGLICVVAYVGTVFAANWAITRFGVVPVGFGLYAPAGVFFAGLAFTLRDVVQDTLGRKWVVAAILMGGAASFAVSSTLAVASATAFLTSETADFAVYTPLRSKGQWLAALLASNTVGLVFDSVLFLWLAFHSLAFLPGQLVGKTWMTLLATPVVYAYRRFAWSGSTSEPIAPAG